MAPMAVSLVVPADGGLLFLSGFTHGKLKSGSRNCDGHIRRIQRRVVNRAVISTSRNTKVVNEDEIRHFHGTDYNKGWTDARGLTEERILGHFEELSVLVSDRSEMHSILAQQRDNWNRLFHTTTTIASVFAATASAVNGAVPGPGLQVVAIILGMGAAALMALVSKFQPSRLAEEQRHAARFFKRLGADVEATLQVDPRLREEASSYWERSVNTLHALDRAFPLPLTPRDVEEELPKQVGPSKLSGEVDLARPEVKVSRHFHINGWTPSAVEDLKHTAHLLHHSDIPEYVNMANKAKLINLILSITSPLLAATGVALNMAGCTSVAAAVTVGSLFAHTLTHALQMGAVYEVYRNCAGYYGDVEKSIEQVLRLPVQERQDAAIFLHKISMALGRVPAMTPMVPISNKTAGSLF
ncbi:hypothetical protein MPTK1_5g01090 [Marchantia polymorpha subsp. ruderalis]|uniref:Uncharacterized protein n=2 Tax=Marchantia polymorpha TaxID=3197 RepID=A0AAF6BDM5_MARPO|nr:hypothetical protein MARPO_0197s0003 [Marchantia polymorpha]BBN10109.1 hypothetical protein Mp_5g01090 [Marchantia polymorpha subsp. ruderalis]|eukprot:PTQ27451.1 hypothetical protein MARPO_0197s0003 [Marchantia polymorpha]